MKITIKTNCGDITGNQQQGYIEFLGIRYAQPPIGKLRFQPPVRIDKWEGIYNATQFAPMAPQSHADNPPINLEQSEDCLNLNIYTPSTLDEKKPVMVFIHGGGFLIDSCSRPRTNGGALAAKGDVVVVMMEYRLGAFGFLYADGISPNLGLQDQVCALEWVKYHIGEFGGDPDNITIFGQSAGGTSVAYLMVMPSARGLFHKAILQSGAFPLETQESNRRYAKKGTQKFFHHLKIDPENRDDLSEKSTKEIIKAQNKAAGMLIVNERAFYPVIDGKIIPENVSEVLGHQNSPQIPILIGYTAEELPILGGVFKNRILHPFLKWFVIRTVKKLGLNRNQLKSLLQQYRENLSTRELTENREYNHLLSDPNFKIPITNFAETYLKTQNPVFFYRFSYAAPYTNAALHVLDLYFIFATLESNDADKMMKVEGNPLEWNLSNSMLDAWSNFAKNGNPNTSTLPEWPAYNTASKAVMVLNLESNVINSPDEKIRNSWMDYLNGVMQ